MIFYETCLGNHMKAGGLRVVSLSSLEKFYVFHAEQILLSINVLDQERSQLKN